MNREWPQKGCLKEADVIMKGGSQKEKKKSIKPWFFFGISPQVLVVKLEAIKQNQIFMSFFIKWCFTGFAGVNRSTHLNTREREWERESRSTNIRRRKNMIKCNEIPNYN